MSRTLRHRTKHNYQNNFTKHNFCFDSFNPKNIEPKEQKEKERRIRQFINGKWSMNAPKAWRQRFNKARKIKAKNDLREALIKNEFDNYTPLKWIKDVNWYYF